MFSIFSSEILLMVEDTESVSTGQLAAAYHKSYICFMSHIKILTG